MLKHPSIYEINTRVWLKRFDTKWRRAKLKDIPDEFWKYLLGRGVEMVWMMGVWKLVDKRVKKYAIVPGLTQEYTKALPDWKEEDVIGSPYAIDVYEVNPSLGSEKDLKELKRKLNQLGMKLILDFVPNHFHAESLLTKTNPGFFLQVKQGEEISHQVECYTSAYDKELVFAHGKDPYFPAWKDTVQVNFASYETRSFMKQQLLKIGSLCDGVRCDMAMLVLNEIFYKTWGRNVGSEILGFEEFWPSAIEGVKKSFPDFLFIAEVYWDLEWKLQQQGFDYTYDKRLIDRLKHESVNSIRQHLLADYNFQIKLVRFLENHDEDRILSQFHSKKAEASALAVYTLPGLRFFYQGQWEGRKIRLPVQLGREPDESKCSCMINLDLEEVYDQNSLEKWMDPVCYCTYSFYSNFLTTINRPIFKFGDWELWDLSNLVANEGTTDHLLAWSWKYEEEEILVVINYSDYNFKGAMPNYWGYEKADNLVNSHPIELNQENRFKVDLPAWQGMIIQFG